jgi:hypothetical protein
MARQASKPEVMNDRSQSMNKKVHTCAFSFDILFILYYASNLHQRTPVVPDPPLDDSDLLPPNANDMKFTETQELVAEFFGIVLILFGDGRPIRQKYSLPRQAAKAAILHGADIIPSITVVREWIGLSALPRVSPADTSGM